MRALTVMPGHGGSAAVTELDEPVAGAGEPLVDGIALGVCATDREIATGAYGWPAPGRERLIIGHESLGRVRSAPDGSCFAPGDLVVGMVRRPDPTPCSACARGELDMCRNGTYAECGIKRLDGYGAQAWTVEANYAMKLDAALARVGVLVEPTTIEATGVGGAAVDAIEHARHGAIVCLLGVSPRGQRLTVDAGALNRTLVLENEVVFGSVSANRKALPPRGAGAHPGRRGMARRHGHAARAARSLRRGTRRAPE